MKSLSAQLKASVRHIGLHVVQIAIVLVLAAGPASSDDARRGSSRASAAPTELDEIQDFLKKNVIDRTLAAEITSKITDGRTETEFRRKVFYCNIVRNADSLRFDMVVVIKQKNYDLDEKGVRVAKPPVVRDRAMASRIELRLMQSTKRVIGTGLGLTNSLQDPGADAMTVRIRLKEGKLEMIEGSSLYSDLFGPAGTFISGASETTTLFEVHDGKLSATTTERAFAVDPETLERRPLPHHVVLKGTEIESLY